VAVLTTCQDIISMALDFAGESNAVIGAQYVSEFRPDALTYLNRLQMAILSGANEFNVEMGEPFPWAVEAEPIRFALKTVVQIDVALVQNSTTITFQTTPTENLLGRYLNLDGDSDFYRISAHSGTSTTATIDQAYIKDSTTNNCNLYALDYSLGTNVLRLVGAMRINAASIPNNTQQAQMSDMNVMLRDFPLTYLRTCIPDKFAIKYANVATNEYVARINSNPNEACRVEIDYVKIPTALTDSSSSSPMCPIIHRMALVYGVAYYILLDKGDNSADKFYQQTQAAFVSMVKEAKAQRSSSSYDRARLIPRMEQTSGPKRPWYGVWTY